MIKEVTYLSPEYASLEELTAAEDVVGWDHSTASQFAKCPRAGQYAVRLGLEQREEALPLLTGRAIHAGVDVLFTSGDEELAIAAVVDEFGDREPPPPGHKYGHLTSGFVENVFKNYIVWAKNHVTFKPLVLDLEELNLENVVAAMWRVLPDGKVILGESKLIMRFDIDGTPFIYSGKPDLPITMGDRTYVMDTKVSCGGYLSDWYFDQHVVSNQLRCYCLMIAELTGRKVDGAYINGIYAGEKALEERTKSGAKSKVTKFMPYGPLLFTESQQREAIWNQFAWREMAFAFEQLGKSFPNQYRDFGYPQNTGKSCQGCRFLPLCSATPRLRPSKMQSDYAQKRKTFLEL